MIFLKHTLITMIVYNTNVPNRRFFKINNEAAIQLNIMQLLNHAYEELLVGKRMILR